MSEITPDMTPDEKRAMKRRMKSAARLYAVQALFQMEAAGQTVDKVQVEFCLLYTSDAADE